MNKKEHLSFSTANKLLSYPLPIAVHKIHETFTPNPAMLFGSLVDAMLTDQEELKKYLVLEGKAANGSTKEGKAAKKDAEEQGLTIVKKEVWDGAHQCADNVMAHPVAGRSLCSLSVQTQLKLVGYEHGTKMLGFADVWDEENGILFDLKTTNAMSFQDPAKTIYNSRWFLQLFMYMKMLDLDIIPRMGWIVALSEPPYSVEVWWMDHEWQEIARRQFSRALELFGDYQTYTPTDATSLTREVTPLGWMR